MTAWQKSLSARDANLFKGVFCSLITDCCFMWAAQTVVWDQKERLSPWTTQLLWPKLAQFHPSWLLSLRLLETFWPEVCNPNSLKCRFYPLWYQIPICQTVNSSDGLIIFIYCIYIYVIHFMLPCGISFVFLNYLNVIQKGKEQKIL